MESLRQQLSELSHQRDELTCLAEVRTLIANRLAKLVLGYLLNSPYAFAGERLTLGSYAELLHTILDSGVISKELWLNLMRIQDACDTCAVPAMTSAPRQAIFPPMTARLSCDNAPEDPRKAGFLRCVDDVLRELDLHASALLLMSRYEGLPSFPGRQRH